MRQTQVVKASDRVGRKTGRLVELAQGGDAVAFTELHTMYKGVVHSVVLARVERDRADDLVQDVFLRAWERLDMLRRPEAFGPWLLNIARNRVRDHRRRDRATASMPDIGRPPPPTAEAKQALAAIRALPDHYSEPLMMRLVEGLTGAEIAERTGLTPGSVRVNLHRGMARLRAALEIDDE